MNIDCTENNWNMIPHTKDEFISPKSRKIDEYYKGYKYKTIYTSDEYVTAISPSSDFLESIYSIKNWCKTTCKGRYRIDLHRVIKQVSFNKENEQIEEWIINDINGIDILVFSFIEEQDYVWFKLKWEK